MDKMGAAVVSLRSIGLIWRLLVRLVTSLLVLCVVVAPPRRVVGADVQDDEVFQEELLLRPLPGGEILAHFQFTTERSATASASTHHVFPNALSQVIERFGVDELHLSLTSGRWRGEWGVAPRHAPQGLELWAWLDGTNQTSVDTRWKHLAASLGALSCSSLLELDERSTTSPTRLFGRSRGAQQKNRSVDERDFLRYGQLPREAVCTENLTPWLKMLVCRDASGLASLLNPLVLYAHNYHSMALHTRQKRRGGRVVAIEAVQTISVVFRSNESQRSGADVARLFDRTLAGACPFASRTDITVDTSFLAPDSLKASVEVVPVESRPWLRRVHVPRESDDRSNVVDLSFDWEVVASEGDACDAPVSVHSTFTGQGMERGGYSTHIRNCANQDIDVTILAVFPWYMRLFWQTFTIRRDGVPVSTAETNRLLAGNILPSRDSGRPARLELPLRLTANSSSVLSIQFDKAFLDWTSFPPDPHRGFDIPAVVASISPESVGSLSTEIRGGELMQLQLDWSSVGQTNVDSFGFCVYGESLLLILPTPDFSMPYNVITLSSIAIVLFYGAVFNSMTRHVPRDPDSGEPLRSGSPLLRIINFVVSLFQRGGESRTDTDHRPKTE